MRGAAGWGENDAGLMAKRVVLSLLIDFGRREGGGTRERRGGFTRGTTTAAASLGRLPAGSWIGSSRPHSWRRRCVAAVEKRREARRGGGGRKAALPVGSRID